MTPAARIQATIELLGEIEARDAPADSIAGGYFRKRRFIGAKDRRAVSDLLYQVLRNRAKLDWWLGGAAVHGARGRVIAGLALLRKLGPVELADLFDGSRYGPEPLDEHERAQADRLDAGALVDPAQPPAVRGEVPTWLYERLSASLGARCGRELAALAGEAPVDLRVNTLKTDREALRRRLAKAGIEAAATSLSPLGLRLVARRSLPALEAFREGWFEVQDEGSQLVALLADARPGMAVADLCAGGGGKALALGAAMSGEGRLVALDSDGARLAKARPRLRRAGLESVELVALDDADDPRGDSDLGTFDRVLVDAPCSGSGAWRRSPDARWRLTPERLAGYRATQARVLDRGAGLVKPGGRLVYATCSLLQEENEAQAVSFLDRHEEFRPLAVPEVWASCLAGPCPSPGPSLHLTPAGQGTDGFFVAVFERAV